MLGFAGPMRQTTGGDDRDALRAFCSKTLPRNWPKAKQRFAVGIGGVSVFRMTGTTGMAMLGFKKCSGKKVAWSNRSSSEKLGSKPPSRQASINSHAELGVAGHARFGNAQPLFDRAVVVLRAADAEGRHLVQEKICPVLDAEGDDDIGLAPRRASLAEFPIVAEKVLRLFFRRGFGPGGHSRRMAGGAGKYDRHDLLQSFQRFGVVFVGDFVQQRERPQQQRVNAQRVKRAHVDIERRLRFRVAQFIILDELPPGSWR